MKNDQGVTEIANIFFLPDLLKCDPQAGEGSVKFTEVSKELNSRQGLSEDCRLMAALTLLSSIKGVIYFGGVCPPAA